jgi:hypothetical protein
MLQSYKTQVKEIKKDRDKGREISCSKIGNFKIVEMPIFHKPFIGLM